MNVDNPIGLAWEGLERPPWKGKAEGQGAIRQRRQRGCGQSPVPGRALRGPRKCTSEVFRESRGNERKTYSRRLERINPMDVLLGVAGGCWWAGKRQWYTWLLNRGWWGRWQGQK